MFGNGTVVSGMEPGGVKDNTIGWETTSQYNFGFDLSMFSGRLSLSANYYLSYTRDLLFEQPMYPTQKYAMRVLTYSSMDVFWHIRIITLI